MPILELECEIMYFHVRKWDGGGPAWIWRWALLTDKLSEMNWCALCTATAQLLNDPSHVTKHNSVMYATSSVVACLQENGT